MSFRTRILSDGGAGSSSSDEEEYKHKKVKLNNPNIEKLSEDVLYHLALGTSSHDLQDMFGDVKFVVVGGSPRRMERFAHFMCKELKYNIPAGQTLVNIAGATDRYALYKVGPILMASHGIGLGSFSVMMHEIIKALYHAQVNSDVTFFRIGTSGGIGLPAGTVVVSESAVDGLLRPYMEMHILGKTVERPSVLDQKLAKDLVACSRDQDGFETILGKTMCTTDFYEGQGRLDGAFCEYTEADKMAFLKQCYDNGVRNIEMESLCFAAMCHMAGVRGAVACVTLLDRLEGDQVDSSRDTLHAWDQRPAQLVSRWIRKQLGLEE